MQHEIQDVNFYDSFIILNFWLILRKIVLYVHIRTSTVFEI